MAVTKLYLIRHGQSAGNAEGRFGGHGATSLSDLGMKQAEMTAKAMQKERITAIYSSDLLRAVNTAEYLAKLCNLTVNATPAFRERHVGVLEGLTFDESREQHPEDYYALVKRNVNHVIKNGESYRQLLKRATTELWNIVRENEGGRVAVFSHTGAICFMTLHLIGAIRSDTKQTPWLVTANCGINRFDIRSRRNIRVWAINDTRHLTDLTGHDSFGAK